MSDNTSQVPSTDVAVKSVDAQNTVSDFQSGTMALFSTLNTSDKAGQLALLTAISDATPVSDLIASGEPILLKHFVLQATTVTQDDGSEKDAVRTILIDADDNAYAAVSDGLVKALQNTIAIMGHPQKWTEPLAIKVVEKKSRKGFRFTTISYAV